MSVPKGLLLCEHLHGVQAQLREPAQVQEGGHVSVTISVSSRSPFLFRSECNQTERPSLVRHDDGG